MEAVQSRDSKDLAYMSNAAIMIQFLEDAYIKGTAAQNWLFKESSISRMKIVTAVKQSLGERGTDNKPDLSHVLSRCENKVK